MNEEIVGKGHISAKVIEDSINSSGVRLITYQLLYPRFILAEVNTHRVFSRSSSSSRAIPVQKMIDQVSMKPAMPIHWGKNQKGMQAKEELEDFDKRQAMSTWLESAHRAVQSARMLASTGAHKQIVNRVLEPFQFTSTVLTSTFYDNFYELRYHEDAQPEFYELARVMHIAGVVSTPKELVSGQWHLPYITENERKSLSLKEQVTASTARCCRVSYLKHDGTFSTLAEDLELHDRLVGSIPRHSSPAEHQATPKGFMDRLLTGSKYSGNFDKTWIQYRKVIEAVKVDKYVGW